MQFKDMNKVNPKTVWARITSSTPVFFRKVRWYMVSCGAIGTALAALPSEQTAWLPINTSSMLITVGAVGTVLTSLAVDPKAKN